MSEPREDDPQVMADLYMVDMENAIRGLMAGDKTLIDPVRLEIMIGQLYTLSDETWRSQTQIIHTPKTMVLQ